MHKEIDQQIEKILKELPKLEQRQYDLLTQLHYLSKLAIKFGLYDADDYLKNKSSDIAVNRYVEWNRKKGSKI